MRTDISGKVRNLPALTESTILMPIFEAVANSIQSIRDRRVRGRIRIELARSKTQTILPSVDSPNPFEHCAIYDDGEGFTEENYQAFNTAESLKKAKFGGKGVGRFVWLKAFRRAEVSSNYCDGQEWTKRRFSFVPDGDGIEEYSKEPSAEQRHDTKIHLMHLHPDYFNIFPRSLDRIAEGIIEHFMLYLLTGNPPQISVSADNRTIDLADLYEKAYSPYSKVDTFKIGKHDFRIDHVRRFGASEREHKLHLCAHYRQVEKESLRRTIPALATRLNDDGRSFVWSSYLSGEYLDTTADVDRNRFRIPKGDEESFDRMFGVPTRADIRDKVAEFVKAHLDPLLRPIKEETSSRVNGYVRKKAPRFRPILKYRPEIIDNIPPNADEVLIEEYLNRALYEHEASIRKLGDDLGFYPVRTKAQFDVVLRKYNEYLDKVNDLGKATLAQHVVYRRLMLDLLQYSLQLDREGKYQSEQSVHGIIFPLRHTSDDVLYEQQNLWIIDERLAYHWFLASDLPFRSMGDVVAVEDSGRPDIIIFDRPHAFVETNAPLSSVVIIEFKKPMRQRYDDGEDPITQVYGYIERLRGNQEPDPQGRPIRVAPDTRFFCYIICDITPKIEVARQRYSLRRSPDGEGFFGYNEEYRAYVEILSYTKLLLDAEKRNAILFKRLNLPEPEKAFRGFDIQEMDSSEDAEKPTSSVGEGSSGAGD